jgi:hypothetical protein
MSGMTRKHFNKIAQDFQLVRRTVREDPKVNKADRETRAACRATLDSLAAELAITFKEENGYFDRQRFLDACQEEI